MTIARPTRLPLGLITLAVALTACGGGGSGGGSTATSTSTKAESSLSSSVSSSVVSSIVATSSSSSSNVDKIPAAFSFTATTNAALSTAITSAAVTLSGFDVAVPISITNGEYSINGGAFTSATGTISPSQTLAVKVISSSANNTPVEATLNVGGVRAAYRVTTLATAVACPDGSAFTLDVTGEEALPSSFVQDMRCTFFSVYPALVSRFNLAAPTTVGMHFVDEPGVAWTSGTNTYYAIDAMLPYPNGTDVVVHEIMHVIQRGYVSSVPGWYIEGSADYVRDAFGLRKAEFDWVLPAGYESGQHYRNGYRVTAAFFKWIDATYRQNQAPIVDAIDDLARAGTYSASSWQALTGYDVDTLWYQYSGGLALVPATSGVRFYGDSNYQGDASYLGVGSYDLGDLEERGINNDWISTIQIPAGYTVTVYEHSGFQGASAVFTSDVIFWNKEQWNNKISSVVITQL